MLAGFLLLMRLFFDYAQQIPLGTLFGELQSTAGTFSWRHNPVQFHRFPCLEWQEPSLNPITRRPRVFCSVWEDLTLGRQCVEIH